MSNEQPNMLSKMYSAAQALQNGQADLIEQIGELTENQQETETRVRSLNERASTLEGECGFRRGFKPKTH